MQMREERGNRPPTAFLARKVSTPSPGIKVRQQNLIHRIVNGVGFQQHSREITRRIQSASHCLSLPLPSHNAP